MCRDQIQYLLVGNVVDTGAQIVQLAVVLVLLLLSPGLDR